MFFNKKNKEENQEFSAEDMKEEHKEEVPKRQQEDQDFEHDQIKDIEIEYGLGIPVKESANLEQR